jgi:Ca2+-binding RTX toxin-like protein
MCDESSEKHVYSLVDTPIAGTTGTGLDQFVSYVFADPGLAGETDSKDIIAGAQAADQLNHLILEAAAAAVSGGAAADGVFTVAEVTAMNAWIRTNKLAEWTALHGDDEYDSETGYHLVQNDGSNLNYRGDNLLDTVIDGVYHMGFEICDGRFLNEDGDPNAYVEQVAEWLTQAYVDHSTTNSGLDRLTDTILADEGLGCNISDAEIAAGADAANGLNKLLREAISKTGILNDGSISAADVTTLANCIQGDAALKASWASLHGADSKVTGESGFHLVKGDGANEWMFGTGFVDKVLEGIYDIGFGVNATGQVLNEKGKAGATTTQVADWLNYFLADQSTTGTGLDHIVDFIKQDRGLAECTSAADIKEGIADANTMNGLIVDLIAATHANDDGWINAEDLVKMNAAIRGNEAALTLWTELHGDDEDDSETGYHLIQNDGANTDFFGENLVNTVADGIYHMCFEICDGRFLNEDGDLNQTLDDVATWLNFFYNEATVVEGGWGDDVLVADERTSQINAGGGDDSVSGGIGNDLIYGSWGDDSIDGGAGNDLIYGGSGNDKLAGGAGDDVFRVTGNDTDCCDFECYDTYEGGTGTDKIVAYGGNVDIGLLDFTATNGIEMIDASGAGNVRLLGNWEANVLDFSKVEIKGTVTIDGGGGDDTIVGTGGNDVIEGGSWGNQSISGGAGNDIIHGGGSDDTLSGGAGDDVFRVTGNDADGCSFEGYDSIDGGAGNDSIVAYGGNVDIGLAGFSDANGIEVIDASGATGTVRLLGNWEDNTLDFSKVTLLTQQGCNNITIDGGGGNDTIIGSTGDDVIEGGSWGNQSISGGAGNDIIHGGGSDDILSGGAGNDTFRVTGTNTSKGAFEGYDSYDGGDGTDTIAAYGANVDIGLTSFGADNHIEKIDATKATGSVRLLGNWDANTLNFSGVTLSGNIAIDGGGGNDTITGSAGNDVIRGGTGDDLLYGGSGNDTFQVSGNKASGFAGYDTFDGGVGTDRIMAVGAKVDIGMTAFGAGSGIETIETDPGAVVRILGDWNTNVFDFSGTTLTGNITIDGGGGNDSITGSAGKDLIRGGTGDDTLLGGAGDDVFQVTGNKSSGFEGYDSIFGGTGVDKIVAVGAKVDIGMSAFGSANGIETIETDAGAVVSLLGDWNANVFDFTGTTLTGNITIDGAGGNDTITGSAGNDVFHGGTGNDVLSGGGGNDTFRVTGNSGSGFEGYDSDFGGAGADRIVAYGGKVDIGMTAFAAGSVETIDGSAATGAVRVLGDWQNNTLDFSSTSFVGNAAGSISINGGGGNDVITGSASYDDKILGGDGNDTLNGMGGNDILTGGNGNDIFAFGAGWGHDTVTDFKRGTDKLNFHDAGVTGMANLTITAEGTNTRIAFGGYDVLLNNVQATKLTASDFVF